MPVRRDTTRDTYLGQLADRGMLPARLVHLDTEVLHELTEGTFVLSPTSFRHQPRDLAVAERAVLVCQMGHDRPWQWIEVERSDPFTITIHCYDISERFRYLSIYRELVSGQGENIDVVYNASTRVWVDVEVENLDG